ncbi:U3 small nucleolar RNA-associated protein 6 homolog [Leguminivora glycinivorella]|uniref:U3 small nucleolar RNA-associated protein 6 homolog n=1 Tax=Leguminivora glycinivorella TaxID=1035111 RepID=UPI00200BD198|nr:U3 small nucleolar RNA-associated protein 6 homolog [Leguminivora glycinivorella]
MAEQVNQRIEDMINELEQMRRTGLYDEDEIREISRKRKEFEYRIQRRVKEKDDYVHYIAYELALIEDIAIRRKKTKLNEKKKDLEYAIAKRVNKVFKQFIYRFQNDLEIYFQYIKFCRSVGFDYAVSAIIGQMLQMHGDKPKMWQMAALWESEEQNNLDNAKNFLLKGIHRHPQACELYLDLFKIEVTLALKAENEEEKEKQIKRADVIWRNGAKSIGDVSYLFKLCDLSLKFQDTESITEEIKREIWSQNDKKEVWPYIASKELEGCHWEEIDEFVDENSKFPINLLRCISVYEEALQRFPDEKLCSKFIHELLGLNENVCSENQKVTAIKDAWMFGHENGLLSDDMYAFGIELLKLEDSLNSAELGQILDAATMRNPRSKSVWKEKILLSKQNENKLLSILKDATKVLEQDDAICLWNTALDIIEKKETLMALHKKFQNCEMAVLLAIKPKLLQKMYDHNGLKAARELYDELIKTPPLQKDVQYVMIEIEKSQDNPSAKVIRKYYEYLVHHHGQDNVDVWMDYISFESTLGSAQFSPAIYRRAVATLKKELVDEFIKAQTLAKIK